MTGIEPPASFRPLPEGVPVGDLVARVGEPVEVLGDARRPILGIGVLDPGHEGALSFCEAADAATRIERSASTVIVARADRAAGATGAPPGRTLILAEDPRGWFIAAVEALIPGSSRPPDPEPGVHALARVDPGARISPQAAIGAGVAIASGTRVGPGAVIYAGTVIGRDCCIGPAAIIGFVGMAYHTRRDGRRIFFPHLAGVRIGERVDIGAQTCVCRGMLTDTVIGDDARIGSLAYVSHGVAIGAGAWISASCAIAGHSRVGRGCVIGIGAKLMDNVALPDGTLVGGGSVVTRDARPGEKLFGVPARHLRTMGRFGPTPR